MKKRPETYKVYKEQVKYDYSLKVKEIENTLPPYCKAFRIDIADNYQESSQYNTLADIKLFLIFLQQQNPNLKNTDIKNISLDILDQVSILDINEYKDWLSYYEAENGLQKNEAAGKRRKLSSLKAFFSYLTKTDGIRKNPTIEVRLPKLPDKEVFALNQEQIEKLLNTIKNGDGLTTRQSKIRDKIWLRDYSIVTILLGTAMRVSELVGLNLENIDVSTNETKLKVIRKGGKEDHVYIGKDVEEALFSYMDHCRMELLNYDDEVQALFVSWNGTRLTVRAVENIISKYSAIAFGDGNKIHPHSLRSTRGSIIYEQTGDIECVKEVLGHASISTSSNYYVKGSEKRKKAAMTHLIQKKINKEKN